MAEQKPTQLPAQRHQGEGSIGSGDQKIDRRMINDLQNVTCAGADERVIQSRADVDQHQCAAKDRATGNLPSSPTHRSDHQYNRSGESEHRPDAMRNGVRDDVAQTVFLDHRKMINIRVFGR